MRKLPAGKRRRFVDALFLLSPALFRHVPANSTPLEEDSRGAKPVPNGGEAVYKGQIIYPAYKTEAVIEEKDGYETERVVGLAVEHIFTGRRAGRPDGRLSRQRALAVSASQR